MAIGKTILFITGALAGVALMFVVQRTDNSQTPQTDRPALQDSRAESQRSPFNTVQDAQTEVALSPAATTAAEPAEDVTELIARITEAELRISELEVTIAELESDRPPPQEVENADNSENLLSAGFEPQTITAIETIRNEAQLQRLELRDLATREGWINTDRFRQESRTLSRETTLRDTLGDEDYDRLLAAEGRDNRVKIESVIANSAADIAGMEAGDIILRYGDERIFSFRDLRFATASGERNETVTVRVVRGGEVVDLAILRGPMGVNLNGVLQEP